MMSQIAGVPSLSYKIRTADRKELLTLLQQAKVSTGHWDGRRIYIEGYKGKMSFSEVASRVEDHYQAVVEIMQWRHEKYKKDSTSSFDPMPFRGKGGILQNLLILPLTAPIKMLADAACQATALIPRLSEEEEAKIAPVLEWRRDIDRAMDSLFDSSQKELNRRASRSCLGSVASLWDSFLDRQSNWRNVHGQDPTIFAEMTRKRHALA